MQPPQQQMGAPQPYYGYQPGGQPGMGMGMPMMIGKRMIFFAVGLGFLLCWIALVVAATVALDSGGLKAITVLFLLGSLFGFGGSLIGALGSPKTDGHQNQGLLALAGFWLVFTVLGFLFMGFGAILRLIP
ncbi:MAG TPA: hypothetical protein VEM95_01070 [Thermoplasmata archaeon]|nr:hypothetical protein [Thermoplasmata archaeon]